LYLLACPRERCNFRASKRGAGGGVWLLGSVADLRCRQAARWAAHKYLVPPRFIYQGKIKELIQEENTGGNTSRIYREI